MRIINFIFSLVLGALLVYGGINKFSKPIPGPHEVIEKAQKFQKPEQRQTLQKILYINGMKQTNYFWQFLGIVELLAGLLMISQVFRVMGAIIALPVVIHIFLFHIFLERDETGELLQATLWLFINIWLIVPGFKRLKPIIYQPKKLNFKNDKK